MTAFHDLEERVRALEEKAKRSPVDDYSVKARMEDERLADSIAKSNREWHNFPLILDAEIAAPVGTVVMFAGATAPPGWLLCDGTAVSRTTYATLFALVGVTYGVGDGATTFNLPDMRGRAVVGLNSSDTDFDALGETGGAKTVASAGTNSAPVFTGDPLAAHTHGIGTYSAANESAHTHGVTSNVTVGNHTFTQPTIAWPVAVPTAANESSHTHSVTSNVTGTLTPAGTIAWPAGVPTFAGSALAGHAHGVGTYAAANESAHTHSVTSNVTVDDHGAHSHTFTSSSNAATPDLLSPDLAGTGVAASGTTSTEILSHTGLVTNNAVTSGAGSSHTHSLSGLSESVSGGTPAGTISWPAGVPTFTGTTDQAVTMTNNAVTSAAGSAHTHTISWPGDVPTASGGAVDAHAVTNNAVTSNAGSAHTHTLSGTSDATSGGTPSGAVSAPTFTGTPTSVVQPYLVFNFIIRA